MEDERLIPVFDGYMTLSIFELLRAFRPVVMVGVLLGDVVRASCFVLGLVDPSALILLGAECGVATCGTFFAGGGGAAHCAVDGAAPRRRRGGRHVAVGGWPRLGPGPG